MDCEKDTGKKPLIINDYRKLLEDKSIDAVSLASPNHWHALRMTLLAEPLATVDNSLFFGTSNASKLGG